MKKFLAIIAASALIWGTSPAVACTTTMTAGAISSYTAAFNSGDLTSLAQGDAVMSGVAAINNASNGDLYASIAVQITLSSAVYGGDLKVYLFALNPGAGSGATTFGDGLISSTGSGGAKAYLPLQVTDCDIPAPTVTTTVIQGTCPIVALPQTSFVPVVYNNLNTGGSGAALSGTAANNKVELFTYNPKCS
jgi:hypothetical protein